LNGECVRSASGYDAITDDRILHIPHGKAGDPATALAICKAQGVVVEKLRRMTPEKAAVVYATTLATATPEN
jgi:hypothetical protein